MFNKSFKVVSCICQGVSRGFKRVSCVLQAYFNGDSRILEWCKRVSSKMFRGCFKGGLIISHVFAYFMCFY